MKSVYTQLEDYCRAKGYPWYTEPYRLNLVYLRGEGVGAWDDRCCVSWVDKSGMRFTRLITVSTEASLEEWTNPTHPDGCIWIKDGCYVDAFEVGLHKGRPALRQRKAFDYVRWTESGAPTFQDLMDLPEGLVFTAVRGTHHHNRVSAQEPDRPKDGDSEGCVLTKSQGDHIELMGLMAIQVREARHKYLSPVFARKQTFDLWT